MRRSMALALLVLAAAGSAAAQDAGAEEAPRGGGLAETLLGQAAYWRALDHVGVHGLTLWSLPLAAALAPRGAPAHRALLALAFGFAVAAIPGAGGLGMPLVLAGVGGGVGALYVRWWGGGAAMGLRFALAGTFLAGLSTDLVHVGTGRWDGVAVIGGAGLADGLVLGPAVAAGLFLAAEGIVRLARWLDAREATGSPP